MGVKAKRVLYIYIKYLLGKERKKRRKGIRKNKGVTLRSTFQIQAHL